MNQTANGLAATASEKGEFQFEFPYTNVVLEPGRYELKAIHEGYFEGTAHFGISRETLTQLSQISLYPDGVIYSCDSPLIHR